MIIKVITSRHVPKLEKKINKGIWFIWYYAEWCGHCKTMSSEWDNLSKMIPKNINLAAVESKALPSMNNKPNVIGYPTLKLYDNGNEVSDYEGERTANGFKEFLDNFIQKSHQSDQKTVISKSPTKSSQPTIIRLPATNQLNPNLENAILNSKNIDFPVENKSTSNKINQNEHISNIIERLSVPSPHKDNNVNTLSLMPAFKSKSKSKSKSRSRTLDQIINESKEVNKLSMTNNLLNALERHSKTKSMKPNNQTKSIKIKLLNTNNNLPKTQLNNLTNNQLNNLPNNLLNNLLKRNSKTNRKTNRKTNNRASKRISIGGNNQDRANNRVSIRGNINRDNNIGDNIGNNIRTKLASIKGNNNKRKTSLRGDYPNVRQDSFFADVGDIKQDELIHAPGQVPFGQGKKKRNKRKRKNKGKGRGALPQ